MKLIFTFLLNLSLFGATAISSISCAGGIATVTVANTLVAAQGFEITGTTVSAYNINSSAVTANASSFTFNVPCNGTATGGAFLPAQQIIVLNVVPAPQQNGFNATDVFWNTTTSPIACPSCSSQWSGTTAAQLAAIKAGTTVESVQSLFISNTTSIAQMEALILSLYTTIQASFVTGLTQFAGFCFNGTTWGASCN